MELSELFLKKEEFPILHGRDFQIPIHLKLLDKNIQIREEIAKEIFSQVAEEWYNELAEYAENRDGKDKEELDWIKEVFLKEKPVIINEYKNQRIKHLSWEDEVFFDDNGFVRGFSISRNSGGSLFFDKDADNCYSYIPSRYIKLSNKKVEEFQCEKAGEISLAYVYAPHNIDNFPGALFLRNWTIAYMNRVFSEIFR